MTNEETPGEEIPENGERSEEVIAELKPVPPFRLFPFSRNWQAILCLVVLSFVFYWKTLRNEHALNDGIVIQQNSYVLQGIRGIKGIFSKDLYHSFYFRMNAKDQLEYGRYRPLSVLSFALEQEFLGVHRSGHYYRAQDLNDNGVLDGKPTVEKNEQGESLVTYEFNEFIDLNGDLAPQPHECYNCWDLNKNFKNDPAEDLNVDGVFNEVDCHVYGASFRHFNNVLAYMICCLLIFLFLRKHIFYESPDLAFLCSLVFLIHPVHSEVVANISGRDDIFSLIFILLTLNCAFNYLLNHRLRSLGSAGLCLFLALLSKEYAMVIMFLVPLFFYYRKERLPDLKTWMLLIIPFILWILLMSFLDIRNFYYGLSPLIVLLPLALLYAVYALAIRKLLLYATSEIMAVFCAVSLFYYALRLNAVDLLVDVPDSEILNNPFLLADETQQFATKVFVLLKYLGLVFFPHPLISDYSYNSIELRGVTDPMFIVAMAVYLFLLISGIILLKRQHITGLAILVYLLFILVISNLVFNTHLIMLESYLFHANLGSALFIGWVIFYVFNRIAEKRLLVARTGLLLSCAVLVFLCGCKAWERSADWRNDVTLFLKDVKNAPNSVLVLGNAGARWVDLADTREITGIEMPGQHAPLNDYNGQLKIDEAEWRSQGYHSKKEAALYRGISYLQHAVELHPRYVNGYLNLGLSYYKLKDDDSTLFYWKLAEYYYPKNPYLENYYAVYGSDLMKRASGAYGLGSYQSAVRQYRMLLIIQPDNVDGLLGLSWAYLKLGNTQQARQSLKKILAFQPGHELAKQTWKEHFGEE